MSVIYNAATRTARMNATLAQIDAGSGAGRVKELCFRLRVRDC